MDFSLILNNFLSPPILFFFLGMLAVAVKSDLEIPQPLPKLFSLYLLIAIGFKGGVELTHSGFGSAVLTDLGLAMLMSVIVPVYSFYILKSRLDVYNAAAIAGTYGSISAVTFISATAFLNSVNVDFGGHMVAAMALMESPAIIIAVLFVRLYTQQQGKASTLEWKELFRDAFLNGSVFLLVGALLIGLITGDRGHESVKPFTDSIFRGMFMFFLLDMGLVAARRVSDILKTGSFLILFAIVIPIVNAFMAIGLAWLAGMTPGNAFMFTILCASASYIAVPAAMRMAVPQANPGIYVPMSLAVTFPFNLLVGIPLYYYLIIQWWPL